MKELSDVLSLSADSFSETVRDRLFNNINYDLFNPGVLSEQ